MKLSTDRILTTHVGSLPRSQEVVDLLFAQDRGDAVDEAQFDEVMRRAVAGTVNHQAEVGVDVVSDGETSKINNFLGARKAAHMCSQNTVRAKFHSVPRGCG